MYRVAMNTVADIIEAFGGSTDYARALGKNPSWASECKRRGSIPPRYWEATIAAATERGIALTAEQMIRAHAANVEAA